MEKKLIEIQRRLKNAEERLDALDGPRLGTLKGLRGFDQVGILPLKKDSFIWVGRGSGRSGSLLMLRFFDDGRELAWGVIPSFEPPTG